MRTRARDAGPGMGLDLVEFFSTNRFLFDSLLGGGRVTQKSLAMSLNLSVAVLTGRLRAVGLPTAASQLRAMAMSVADRVMGLDPPPFYRYYRSLAPGDRLSLQCAEFCVPVSPFHIDFDGLLRNRIEWSYDQKFVSFLHSSPIVTDFTTTDQIELDFRSNLSSSLSNFPDFLRTLSNDERFLFNNRLSICFLYGQVTYPIGGIASPHLQGVFSLQSRRTDTGYFLLDQESATPLEHPEEKLNVLFNWLKDNNPLYFNASEPVDFSVFSVVSGRSNDLIGSVVNPYVRDRFLLNDRPPDGALRVPVRFKKPDNETSTAWIPLELALGYTFPMLFPFGPPTTIPGKTLRQKAANILCSDPFYRCGRLACNLVLWFYHLIEENELYYYNTHISLQNVNMPEGSSRNVPNQGRPSDPAFATYWKAKQAQVRAMTNVLGPPDLMITFTFSNQWEDCRSFIAHVQSSFDMGNDMRFCPVDSMHIWKSHFDRASQPAFKNLCRFMQVGDAAHYMWRLEFQARGAPHVHALIWLAEPLPIQGVAHSFFACRPACSTPLLREHVLTHMVHTCNTERCRRGIPTADCRYGFPKTRSDHVHYDDRGRLCLPRGIGDSNIVEYNPCFLLHWDGHCHVNILRTKEHPDVSDRALSYILKYNFKAEPDLSVRVGTDAHQNYEAMFHARVLSAEEAAARVFGMTFCCSDIDCRYCAFHPSDSQVALFRDGVQVQMSLLEQYFHRPLSLERLRILAFFSYYEISPSEISNRVYAAQLRSSGDPLSPPTRERPSGTLARNSTWENDNLPELNMVDFASLFPYEPLPDARSMICRLRFSPKIVITEKFNSNIHTSEDFCFLLLLLSGSWRSEDEMKAGCATWRDAVRYHGIVPQESPELFQIRVLSYMITSNRYSPEEIVRISADCKFDVPEAFSCLKSDLPEV